MGKNFIKLIKYILFFNIAILLSSCNPESSNLYHKYKYNKNLKRVESKINDIEKKNLNYLHISIFWTSGYMKSIDYIYEEIPSTNKKQDKYNIYLYTESNRSEKKNITSKLMYSFYKSIKDKNIKTDVSNIAVQHGIIVYIKLKYNDEIHKIEIPYFYSDNPSLSGIIDTMKENLFYDTMQIL